MLAGGLLLTRLGGIAGFIAGALFFGIGGLGHAVLCGLGLARLPGVEDERAKGGKHDAPR